MPPENLSCGRTDQTTASCAWVAKEPADSVEIQRSTTPKNWTTRAILVPGSTYYGDTGLAPGVAYTYRTRHRRGSDASAWSNTDGVGTTWPEPYGPQPDP